MKKNTCSIKIFESPYLGIKKTFICMGAPRCGTSMVAGVMSMLGVHMGFDLDVNVEDDVFNFEKNKNLPRDDFIKSMVKEIHKRNIEFDIWGWKYPRAQIYIQDLIGDIENPHLVLVFRDPLPSAVRHDSGVDGDTVAHMKNMMRLQINNLNVAELIRCPALLVSYERSILHPRFFIRELSDFLFGEDKIINNIEDIVNYMIPGSYKKLKHKQQLS